MLAGIHFQWINDNGEMLERILSTKKPFVGFVVPGLLNKTLKNNGKEVFGRVYPEGNYYPQWLIDVFKEEVENSNIMWAQEGMFHYCESCFEKFEKNRGREKDHAPEPFHEHV